jgi:hypothetical protein
MNLAPCTCDKCGCEALSVKGTKHRRCPGSMRKDAMTGATIAPVIRPKRDKLETASRGTWE